MKFRALCFLIILSMTWFVLPMQSQESTEEASTTTSPVIAESTEPAAETTSPPSDLSEEPTSESTQSVIVPEQTATVAAPETTPEFPSVETLPLVYSHNFNDLPNDLLGGLGWTVIDIESGKALQSSEGSTDYLTNFAYTDMAAEASVMLATGSASLSVRHTVAGAYSAILSADASLELYRGTVPVALQSANVDTTAWNHLRLEAIGDVVTVSLNGQTFISWQDAQPLPHGQAAFGTRNNGLVRVDEFAVYAQGEAFALNPQAAPVSEAPQEMPENLASLASINCPSAEQIAMATVSSASEQGVGVDAGGRGSTVFNPIRISADGRYVVYLSYSDNLVAGDTNDLPDAFRFDRSNCSTVRVSVDNNGNEFLFPAMWVDMSDDGNLIIINILGELYLRNVSAGTSTFIGYGGEVVISGNGQYLAFRTHHALLPLQDTNDVEDIYRYQISNGALTLVSVGNDESLEDTGNVPQALAISDDGNRIAWVSIDDYDFNLSDDYCDEPLTNQPSRCANVFLRDIAAGTTEIISVNNSGNVSPAPGVTGETVAFEAVSITGDGRYVVFMSQGVLSSADTDTAQDVYIRDTLLNKTTLASVNHLGTSTSTWFYSYGISDNGRYLALQGYAMTATSPGNDQVFVRDLITGTNVLASVSAGGVPANSVFAGYIPVISDDAEYVAFVSNSDNLVPNDTEASCEIDGSEPPDNDENCRDVFLAPVPDFPIIDLSAPSPSMPGNGLMTSINSVSFSWEAVTGAEAYELQYSTSSTFSANVTTLSNLTDTFYDAGTFADGIYYWRLRSYAATGFSSQFSAYSAIWSFTIDTTAPAVPNLLSPLDGGVVSSTLPTVSWQAVSGAGGYTVQFDDSSDFSSPVFSGIVTQTSAVPFVNSPNSPLPLNSPTIYWRVNSVDAALNQSAYSTVRSFSIFLGTHPTYGASVSDQTPIFTWTSVASASNYRLIVDNDSDFSSPLINQTTSTNSFTSATPLLYGSYYWRVDIDYNNDATGFITAATSQSFQIDPHLAPPPILLSPANGSLSNDNSPSFDWADVPEATSYQLEYSSDPNFVIGFGIETTTSSFFNLPGPLGDGIWYWRVRSVNLSPDPQVGDFSPSRSIIIDTVPPATMPVPSAPANNAVLSNTRPAFTWSPVAGASLYHLIIDESASFSPAFASYNSAGTSFTSPQPLPQGVWYWEVRASDTPGNQTDAYTTMQFTVSILSAPVNNAVNSTGKPAFTWVAQTGATSYQLQVDNNSDFTSPEINQTQTGTSFTPITALQDGLYYWRVNITYSSHGLLESQSVRQLIVTGAIPPAPLISAPVNNGFVPTSQPVFTWSTVANASNYVLEVDNTATFSTIPEIQETLATNSFTPSSNLADGVYYMRVRGLSALGASGAYSTVVRFTVDTVGPSIMPGAITPAISARISSVRPTFSWYAVPEGVQYHLWVDDNSDFSSPLVDEIVSTTSYAMPASEAALPQGFLYWRVAAIDAAGNIGVDSSQTFTVFLGTAPADMTLDTTGRPTFIWTSAGAGVTYNIEIDANADTDFSDAFNLNAAPITTTSFTPESILPDGVYIWRVARTSGENFVSDYSETVFVSTNSVPGLLLPANNSLATDNTPNLSWNAVSAMAGATTSYQIQLSRSSTFASGNLDYSTSSTNFDVADTLSDGRWYWRVRSEFYGATGNIFSAYSPVFSFTVDTTAPNAPVLSLPANTATLNDLTPTFTWLAVTGASSYRLDIAHDSSFTAFLPAYEDRLVTGASFTPSNLEMLPQGVFYWRLRAVDAAGNISANSVFRSITLSIGTLPANGTFTSNLRPNFTWVAVPDASSYTLEIDNDTDFSTDLLYTIGLSTLSHVPTIDLPSGTIYWRVVPNTDISLNYRTFFIGTIPAAPVLLIPNNAAISGVNTLDLFWNPVVVSGISVDYEVQLARNNTFTSGLQSSLISGENFTTPTLADGVWYWRVRSRYDGITLGTFSLVRSFTVDTTVPNAPVLSLPANNIITGDLTPALSWLASAGATSYRLDIATDSGFTSFVSGYENRPVNAISFTLPTSDTLSQGQFFWRLRAVDAAGNISNNSISRSFSTFIGTLPQNGAFSSNARPSFSWLAVPGASSYTLQIHSNSSFTAEVYSQSGLTSLSHIPSIDLPAGTLYWRVLPNGGTASSYRTLFITAMPAAPALNAPLNLAITSDNTPLLGWATVTVNSVTIDYEVQLARNATFTTGLVSSVVGTNSHTPSSLADGLWYWRVRARYDGSILGMFSAIRSFTVDTTAPNAPVLSLPANNRTIGDLTPALSWLASAGATSYRLDIAADSGFTSFVTGFSNRTVTGTTFTVPNAEILSQGQYYWRLRAVDAAGNLSSNSISRSFTLFMGTSPANFAMVSTGRPLFTWVSAGSGIQYNLQLDDDGDFSNAVTINPSPLSTTSYTPSTALPSGIHYWRVIWLGEVPVNNVYRAIVVSPPLLAPALTSPLSVAATNDASPMLAWAAVAPVNGLSIRYHVEVNRAATFTPATVTALFTTSNTSESLSSDLAEGRYYWRVRTEYQASNGSFFGPYSVVRSFTVDTIAPTAPILTAPLNGLIINNTRIPQLRWTLVAGATTYQLDIARDSGFTDFVFENVPLSTGAYTIPNALALANGTYYWRVTALDAAGNNTSSQQFSFVIALP